MPKYDSTKTAVVSKFKRLPPPKASTQVTARPEADAVASGFDVGKGGIVPQSMAGGDDAASPAVNDQDVCGSAGRPAGIGSFSPGKVHDDLRGCEVSSASAYATAINGHWHRGVEAFIQIGRLCAEANARLQALTGLEFDAQAVKSNTKPNVGGAVEDSTEGIWLLDHYFPHYRVILSLVAIHHGYLTNSEDLNEENINERVHWSVIAKRRDNTTTPYNSRDLPADIPANKIAEITGEERDLLNGDE